jgi:hypothetical protein
MQEADIIAEGNVKTIWNLKIQDEVNYGIFGQSLQSTSSSVSIFRL